jgi:hypothetical protein
LCAPQDAIAVPLNALAPLDGLKAISTIASECAFPLMLLLLLLPAANGRRVIRARIFFHPVLPECISLISFSLSRRRRLTGRKSSTRNFKVTFLSFSSAEQYILHFLMCAEKE